jgi:lipopolysaccharide/colanic/teichoic acid biosynthesis glycosyltransferase
LFEPMAGEIAERKPNLKIVVTGATGFVGRQLVPLLERGGATVLLVGRDAAAIERIFPGRAACGYADMAERARDFDLLVHLATVNSDTNLSLEAARKVNVGLLVAVVESAVAAGIPDVVNISSTHALSERRMGAYAQTKREAAAWMRTVTRVRGTTLYLPPVYGNRWSGRLGIFNKLPPWLARPLFRAAAALTPTVSVERLAAFILAPIPSDREVILSDGQQRNRFYQCVKRSFEVVFAVVVIAVFWWLLAIIWLLVRLESPGPGIIAQSRVGRDGQVFTFYKFRSMKKTTVQAATHEVSSRAVTRIGGFLRRTKLDELPQVWNILRNEMSLVGPRPCLPIQTDLVEERKKRGVLALKPGITGLSQINGIDMSDPMRLAISDARYLALQSLLLDARIMLATAIGRGQGDRTARPD